jgi:hypothetical protein
MQDADSAPPFEQQACVATSAHGSLPPHRHTPLLQRLASGRLAGRDAGLHRMLQPLQWSSELSTSWHPMPTQQYW